MRRYSVRNPLARLWDLTGQPTGQAMGKGRLELPGMAEAAVHRQNFFFLKEALALLLRSADKLIHIQPDYLG